MDASRTDSITRAFVFKPEDLSLLNKTVRDFLRSNSRVKFIMSCKDGMDRNSDDMKGVQSYDNSEKAEILKLSVVGLSEDRARECSVVLSGDGFWGNIHVVAKGGETSVSTFYDQLTTFFQQMSPWYSRLATLNWVGVFMAILGVISSMLILLGVVVAVFSGRPDILLGGDGRGFFMGIVIVSYSFISGEILNWLRRRMFPLAVFAIGSGLRRHENFEWWRNLLFGGVFVGGVLVGGLVNYLVGLMQK